MPNESLGLYEDSDLLSKRRRPFDPGYDCDRNTTHNNGKRADRAEFALQAYVGNDAIDDTAWYDMLCDFMHLCDREGVSFKELLSRAKCHYKDERQPMPGQPEDFRWDEQKTLNILSILALQGVVAVEVEYDGNGDSGQVDSVAFLDSHGDSVEVKADFDITEEFTNLAYSYLERKWGSWEDNEGSYGSLTFDVKKQRCEITHNERVMDENTTEDAFKLRMPKKQRKGRKHGTPDASRSVVGK